MGLMHPIEELEMIRNGVPRPNELVSEITTIASLNPFPGHVSGPRTGMQTSMTGQAGTPIGLSSPTVFSGSEYHYGEWTDQIRYEEDIHIIKVIARHINVVPRRYPIPSWLVIFEKATPNHRGGIDNEVHFAEWPRFRLKHQQLGYEYKYLIQPRDGLRIPAGTTIAQSYSISESTGMWRYGLQVDTAAVTDARVIEDGIWVSETFCELGTIQCVEEHVFTCGSKSFAKNIKGNYERYKAFADIGERVGEDGILYVLTDYDEEMNHVITSRSAVRQIDYKRDRPCYVEPGAEVIDVEVIKTTDTSGLERGKSLMTPQGMGDQFDRYVKSETYGAEQFIKTYDKLQRENHYNTPFHGSVFSPYIKMRNMLDDVENTAQNARIQKTVRGESIDEYRVKITIAYKLKPGIGSKFTGRHGNKGVIVHISPDHEMPRTASGRIAHYVECALSVMGRMIPSREIEKEYAASADATTARAREMYFDEKLPYEEISDYILGFYEIVSPVSIQFITEEINGKRVLRRDFFDKAIVSDGTEITLLNGEKYFIDKGLHVAVPPIADIPEPIEVIEKLQENYAPERGPVTYYDTTGKEVTTKADILIGGEYIMVLEKHGKSMAAAHSGKISHFGTLTSPSREEKQQYPIKLKTIRFGESENRLFLAMFGPRATGELMDRSNNYHSREIIQETLFLTEDSTNIENLVDREKGGFMNTRIKQLSNHFASVAGRTLKRRRRRDV